jgi:hypothetical protein
MLAADPLDSIDLMNEADSPDAVLAEFNERFFVVNEAGRAVIYCPRVDPIVRRAYHDHLGFADLTKLYLNRTVLVGTNKKGESIFAPVADWWLRHPLRRQFIHGVVFDPTGRAEPGVLNLWQGFAVEAKAGSWELLRTHILSVICGGDQGHFDYLLGWMARMMQRPAEQGEVAVVLRGTEGTGKGTLARALKRILGQHALAISNAKHLTGNFNAHLRDAVFLFADEAFFAGDRQHVGVLKSIITEEYLTIEAKYQNAVQAPNYLHVMMASNEDWVVPASLEARRFFCLEVTETHRNDHEWFAAIWEQMEAGGYEAMLHDLLHYDLTRFNVRAVPDTVALQRQKKLTLPVPEAWWLEVLHRGYLWRSKLGLEAVFGTWCDAAATELLFASYSEFAKDHHERHPLHREAFGRFMLRMKAKPTRKRGLILGEHWTDTVPVGRVAEPIREPGLARGYHLGTLDLARAGFIAGTNLVADWDDEGQEDAQEDGQE